MINSQTILIKKAIFQVENEEIKYLEEFPDVPFVPSEKYNTSLAKLIDFERKRENSLLKLSYRQKAVALIVAITILFTMLTSCIFGKQIKEFFVEIRENMLSLFSPISEDVYNYVEYDFTNIPSDYELVNSKKDVFWRNDEYSNGEHFLYINQCALLGSTTRIDIEGSSYTEEYIGDVILYSTYKNNTRTFVWENDTTSFLIVCHDSISKEKIKEIILTTILTK